MINMGMAWKDLFTETSSTYASSGYVSEEITTGKAFSKDFMDTLSEMADVAEAREKRLAKVGALRRKIEAGDIVHLTLEAINKLFMVNGLSFDGMYFADGAKYTDAARAIEDRMAFKVIHVEKETILDGIGSEYNTYKLAFYGAENYRDGIRGTSSKKADVERVKDLINGDEVLMGRAIDEEIIYVSKRGGHTLGLLADLED